jgi:hypothetical protein
LRLIARAQLQEKLLGVVALKKLEPFDTLVDGKHRPGIEQLVCGKSSLSHRRLL